MSEPTGDSDGDGDSRRRAMSDTLPPGYVGEEQPPPPRSGGPAHARRSRERRPRRRGHPILTALAVLVLIIVVVVGAGILWAQSQISPGGHRGPLVTISVPKGSSTSSIGHILASHGVIHDATLFSLYVRLHGDGPLFPGTYRLAKNSSYESAIAALQTGPKIVTESLLIPEGYTVRQIADAVGALPNMGLSAQRFLATATSGAVSSPYEPAGVYDLEGLLFPATYPVQQGETEVQILEQMVGAFDDRASSLGLQAAAAARHETVYQLVTVASIVEKEAKLDGDRGPVASTIYNRLSAGMALGADSTQTYYLRLSDPEVTPTPSQLDQPSPYNTRVNKGLPPTPIANPGIPSLQAAASPPKTTYLYWVQVNPDGQLGFASSDAGFVSLQAQCRAANLC